jgi:hypothetical protein
MSTTGRADRPPFPVEELPVRPDAPALADPVGFLLEHDPVVGWLLAHQDTAFWALVALFVGVALVRAGYLLLLARRGPGHDEVHGR